MAALPHGCGEQVSGRIKTLKVEGYGTVTVLSAFVRCCAAARNAAEATVCAPAGTTPSRNGKPTRTAGAHTTTQTTIIHLALLLFCAILTFSMRSPPCG